MRLGEIFADVTYVLHASSMTTAGTISLLAATPSNIFFGLFFIQGFLRLEAAKQAGR